MLEQRISTMIINTDKNPQNTKNVGDNSLAAPGLKEAKTDLLKSISYYDGSNTSYYLSSDVPRIIDSRISSAGIKSSETPIEVLFSRQFLERGVNSSSNGSIKLKEIAPEESNSYNKNKFASSSKPYIEGLGTKEEEKKKTYDQEVLVIIFTTEEDETVFEYSVKGIDY